ncbi:MAG: hypothetical protein AUI14_19035 [Actinobacteria bacterium 13_2_20CM_2_71_6]|nr:MAG: hypothetical protein AUI14_19035 [Actinobacteria bacterium 13_2_20CM_2_71_6]
MTTRRLATLGLALFACTTLALAGCGKSASTAGSSAGTATSASPSPTGKPAKDVVLAAIAGLKQTSYKYTIESHGLTGNGVADPVAKKATLSMKGTQSGMSLSIDMVVINPDTWLKMLFGSENASLGLPTKYMHVNVSKVTGGGLGIDPDASDPGRVQELLKVVGDVQRVDAQNYKITLDITGVSAAALDSDTVKKMGDKAKAVPATVTVDSQGHLTAFTVSLAALAPDEGDVKATYSDFGTPVAVKPPAKSDTVEAPASLYGFLNQ